MPLRVVGGGAAVVRRADHHGLAEIGGAIFPGEKQPGDQAPHGVSDEMEPGKLGGLSGAQRGGKEIFRDGRDGLATRRVADIFDMKTCPVQICLQSSHDEGVHPHAVEQHDAFFPAEKLGGWRKHGRGVAEKIFFGNKKCRDNSERRDSLLGQWCRIAQQSG